MIYIIGTGRIAKEYLFALRQMECTYRVIGRSESSVKRFNAELNESASSGGLQNLTIEENSFFINCVGIADLHDVNLQINEFKPRFVLVEKPVFSSIVKAEELGKWYKNRPEYIVATNRLFYDSVQMLSHMLDKDPPISCHFEFNERLYDLNPKEWSRDVLMNWALANSVHVINTVFKLIGQPSFIDVNKVNRNYSFTRYDLYAGHGYTNNDVFFTFNSNWVVKGSWFIEIKSLNHSYRLSPMEELFVDGKSLIAAPSGVKPGFQNMLTSFIHFKRKNFYTVWEFTKELIDLKDLYE